MTYLSEVTFAQKPGECLLNILGSMDYTGLYLVYPADRGNMLLQTLDIKGADIVKIPIQDSEETKTVETTISIWRQLLENNANRNSILINLGGGVTTDTGGFAAACYMRGIRHINIPTTLLACVDASTGGKTGVNLDGIKNIAGAFHKPVTSIISPCFFSTLPPRELLSGWGEVLKHSLLESAECTARYLSMNPFALSEEEWLRVIQESVALKQRVVTEDPYEHGIRRMLNLGHTAGHALEALLINRDGGKDMVSHGHSVAIGLVTALVLSTLHCGFESAWLHRMATRIKELYPAPKFNCKDYDELLRLMHHDKKNRESENVNFSLLHAPGVPAPPFPVTDSDICSALDITRDLLGA